jgi:GWxTD domain-containing protein
MQIIAKHLSEKYLSILILCLMFLLLSPESFARDIFSNNRWEPEFDVQVLTRFDPQNTESELQVFSCLLDAIDLQFRRELNAVGAGEQLTEQYMAEYEFSLEIFTGKNSKNKSVASRYEKFSIVRDAAGYNHKKSEKRWHNFEVALENGEYYWWLEFKDLNSKRGIIRNGLIEVKTGTDWSVSEIWIVSDPDTLAPDPLDFKRMSEFSAGSGTQNLWAYYELRAKTDLTLDLKTTIYNNRNTEVYSRTQTKVLSAGVSQKLTDIGFSRIGSGKFKVILEASIFGASKPSKKKNTLITRESIFYVRWKNSPATPYDLDIAVEQLRYILPVKKFKEMKFSPMGHKKTLFENFWKSVDPSPENEDNELMREYYRRAEFSDVRFSWSRFSGWRSDRGRIYMRFGDPDQIERHSGDLDNPAWERWYYDESGEEYLFIDRHGFGDYVQNIFAN